MHFKQIKTYPNAKAINKALLKTLNALGHWIFPVFCPCCERLLHPGEEDICPICLMNLPRTHYWKFSSHPLQQIFWGRIPAVQVLSWLSFRKAGPVQAILHEIKYKGNQRLARNCGRYFAEECGEWLKELPDCIVPVPLSKRKLRKRGYNQAEEFARGLADVLKIPVRTDLLIKSKDTATQTQKGRYERWENLQHSFKPAKALENISGQHILLVDDVLTTGATLEACARFLLERPGTRVSLFTLACA